MGCNFATQVALDALEAYDHTGVVELVHRIVRDGMEREWISLLVPGEGMQVFSRIPGDASEWKPERYFDESRLQGLSGLLQVINSGHSWYLDEPAVAS